MGMKIERKGIILGSWELLEDMEGAVEGGGEGRGWIKAVFFRCEHRAESMICY